MLRALAVNTAVNAAAFFAGSALALVLVPVLIKAYGIEQYGLLVLVRLFLPLAFFAVFDFGFSELSTQAVARARVSADWQDASVKITALLMAAVVIGVCVGLFLALSALWWTALLKVPPEYRTDVVWLLYLTAVALPLLFVLLVAEGVLKGFEAYRRLRSLEIGVNLVFAALAFAAVVLDYRFSYVGAAFVFVQMLRALAVLEACRRTARRHSGLRLSQMHRLRYSGLGQAIGPMWVSKLLGVTSTQLPPLVVSGWLGPAAAGLFDVIMRLPRFAKMIFGLLNSSVLPVAARLDEASDESQMRRLGQLGLVVVSVLVLPPVIASSLVADRILGLWLGEQFAQYGPWTAIVFVATGLGVILNFGGSALMVQPEKFRRWIRISFLQTLVMYAIAWFFLDMLAERSIVLGTVIAQVVVLVPQARIVAQSQGVNASTWWRLAAFLGLAAALFSLRVIPGLSLASLGWQGLIATIAACLLALWALAWFVLLTNGQRVKVWALFRQGFWRPKDNGNSK